MVHRELWGQTNKTKPSHNQGVDFKHLLDMQILITQAIIWIWQGKVKKKWKIPPRGWGVSGWFSTKKTQKKENMGLKHWILPKDHFKTHLFFSIFGWGDPSQLGSWSYGCVKPLKLSREAIWQVSEDPYHTEFVSWQVDHFSFFFIFFPLRGEEGGGQKLSGKFHYFFFFNPSLRWLTPDM